MGPFMNSLPVSPTRSASTFAGWHRLVLAGAAAAALATLCWAGIQVRAARAEVHRLQQESKPGLASPAPADGERRLTESAAPDKRLAAEHAAREKELERVIEFLRLENAAAQQTIERLSRVEAGAPPEGGGR